MRGRAHTLRRRYGRASNPDFDRALQTYISELGPQSHIGNTHVYGRTVTAEGSGPKYVRIVATDEGGGRSVLVFVERATGDIWAPDGWKKPRKNFPRGNIYKIKPSTQAEKDEQLSRFSMMVERSLVRDYGWTEDAAARAVERDDRAKVEAMHRGGVFPTSAALKIDRETGGL